MMSERKYAFFSHKECEYFPCHATSDAEKFNCLFCYCPLYVLGHQCGGNFTYLPNGYKDCSECMYPHIPDHYDEIVSHYEEILAMMLPGTK